MNYFLLSPRDPLIIRSSRPFEAISDADAAKFPPPSTIAGALRNVYARSQGMNFDNKAHIKQLFECSVTGPLAVKIPKDTSVNELSEANILVPKPTDAQYFRFEGETIIVGMQPLELGEEDGCDLPKGLLPLFLSQNINGKPVKGPRWWALKDLLAWRTGNVPSFKDVVKNGWTPTEPDVRTHIERDNKTLNSVEGQIFQTAGLTMWQQPDCAASFPNEKVSILAGIDGDVTLKAMNLGGERRLAEIQPCELWPTCPSDHGQDMIKAGGLTLTFLTPTIFAQGWRPKWINEDSLIGTPPGCQTLQLKLKAAALERWTPQSGWDLAINKPRATELMIPAGATYWFEIVPGTATKQELARLWMAHLCDGTQHNSNGFGLALPMAYSWHETQD
ncbi:type III-B CRISPR module-associated Cmr3 family protein [Celerinatantimonas sp. MCCC 1A17872]|uniref:type III-B CRISPR module-associated Cmr3 family protein n=1 Tax=Celerinatantimonas sp. MCCC 1A17872 TaxID=3177514 RepID=UPI0038C0702C